MSNIEYEIAKERNLNATLWLADVRKVYNKYGYDLGFKKKGKSRNFRPFIITEPCLSPTVKVIFLTTKNNAGVLCNIECTKNNCLDFYWQEKSRILTKFRNGKKPKRFFELNKEDLNIIGKFCGLCDENYIELIKQELINRYKKVKK